MASQYIDTEGNLCLKLRLFSNAETQCITQQDVKNFNSILSKDGYNIKKLCSKHCNYYIYITYYIILYNIQKNKIKIFFIYIFLYMCIHIHFL